MSSVRPIGVSESTYSELHKVGFSFHCATPPQDKNRVRYY